jgi:hypothetical protein
MKPDQLKYIIASSLVVLLLLLFAGELIARVFGATVVYEYNAMLGWRPTGSFSKAITVLDQSGEKYAINYSTNEFGFREFGDPNSDRKRILIVGDSFTGDPYTSDEDAYFGIIKKKLPVEVFAIGAGGYGTLQQLLLIREFADKINPDILILQFCSNDLENNSFFLEGPSIVRNQKNLRPYWVDGDIKYRLRSYSPYVLLYRSFRLFRTVDALITTFQYQLYGSYFPPQFRDFDFFIPAEAKTPQLKAEIDRQKTSAILTTKFLMSEIRRVLPDAELISFTASTADPEEIGIWEQLTTETGFHSFLSPTMLVQEAEENGEIVRVHDGAHWNRLGNMIVGEELARIIESDLLLAIPSQSSGK